MEKYLRVMDGKKILSGWDVDFRCWKCQEMKGYSAEDIFFANSYHNKFLNWLFVPDSVEEIGAKAFEHCENLKTVYLSANLKHIGFSSFWGCKIEDAYYPKSIFEYEKVQAGQGGKPIFHYLHCSDGTFDFTKEKYIDIFPFNGTVSDWKRQYEKHWLNRRANVIVCTDGTIEH